MSVAESARPSPRRGRKASSEGSSRCGDQLAPPLRRALLVEQVRVEAGVAQGAALLGRDRVLEQVVDRRERVGDRLLARSLDQPGQLDQLEEAGDRAGDVDVGVEPRLAELAAGAPGLLQHLVLDHPVGRLEPLGRPEELLALLLLAWRRGPRARPRRAATGGRCPPRSRRAARGPARPWRGSSPCRAAAAPRPRATGLRRRPRSGTTGGPAGAEPGTAPACSPTTYTRENSSPLVRSSGITRTASAIGWPGSAPSTGAHPRLETGDQVADEVAVRSGRLAARPGGGELAEPREVAKPLGGLRVRGEQPVAAEADPLDQAPHEDVGPHLAHRARRGAVELEELADPVARLRRDLRALERGLERGDHVELAPPGDRRAAGQVDRAQLDRAAG